MPKQGKFAKSSRIKQLNSFKVKRHQQASGIEQKDLVQYLILRYGLTLANRMTEDERNTTDLFMLQVWVRLASQQGNLPEIVQEVITDMNSKVPWQLLRLVDSIWTDQEKFLKKELANAPLDEKVFLTPLSQEDLRMMIAQALAMKGAAATLLKGHASPAIVNQTAQLLLPSFFQNGEIDWEKVRGIFKPLPYEPAEEWSSETRDWLKRLSQRD
ncbi:MAG: hypothetical protein Q3959_03970 [Limosilactobacillus sp.]|uniref:hypothetical protein n=1 Tax=Limosilactobacillus sp. TaxID=2773925 RepID=UPI0026FC5DB9|nr:hypothetical protein [Limosilactobacillus sp.]